MPSIQPRGFEATSSFLTVDFAQLRASAERLITESNVYFPEPLNESLSELVTPDGSSPFSGQANAMLTLFDSITPDTRAIHLRLRHVRFTTNMGLRVPTGPEFTCSLDIAQRRRHFSVYTVAEANAETI